MIHKYSNFHISGIIGRASLSTSSCDIQNQHCRQKRQNTLSSESGQLHDRIVLETAPVALFPHQHATGMSMWIYPKSINNISTVHTVSFDWFLSGLEWILNLEFCLLKLLIFYQKLLWNTRSRLNSSTFWVFRPVFRFIWSKLKLFAQKMKILIKYFKYRLKN